MNSVQLPPGIRVTASGVGVPWGAGRPVRPDPSSATYIARAEIVREQKSGPGRPTIFRDADELRHACNEYFAWVDKNPLLEQQVKFSEKQEKWVEHDKTKKRPYTQGALCIYLGINQETWNNYRNDDRFKDVCAEVGQTIYHQKFEGAAAGFFNANIIARDLGLVDKQEVAGAGGGPVQTITTEMTAAEAAELYAKQREK